MCHDLWRYRTGLIAPGRSHVCGDGRDFFVRQRLLNADGRHGGVKRLAANVELAASAVQNGFGDVTAIAGRDMRVASQGRKHTGNPIAMSLVAIDTRALAAFGKQTCKIPDHPTLALDCCILLPVRTQYRKSRPVI